jgi:carbon-monoxide dehydrogenase medium subunit
LKRVGDKGLIATSIRTARVERVERPTTCDDALALLSKADDPPVILAGGTDLCAQLNEGREASVILSLDAIHELRAIECDRDEIRIGSAVTHAAGSAHRAIREAVPGFAEAWRQIANVRVRFRATLGGNLMARRTRYEGSILLAALQAKLRFLTKDGIVEHTPEDVWNGQTPQRALLHHVAISYGPHRALGYDRSLRPIITVALGLQESDSRAVVATEWLPPLALTIPDGRAGAADVAAAAFAELPDTFHDVATSNWYLRRAGETLLRRQLQAYGYA